MNIFDALSGGKGAINEENVSSFLAYLLNPNETHGLRIAFLERFLEKMELLKTHKHLLYADTIRVFLEQSCEDDVFRKTKKIDDENKGSKASRIDICVAFFNKNKCEFKICIENKININAFKKGQLMEQYTTISNNYRQDSKIMMVYLTPKHKKFTDEFSEFRANFLPKAELMGDLSRHIFIDNIVEIIKDMLDSDDKCEVSPISEYVKHTLKAFVYHILGRGCKEMSFTLNNENFILKRFDNGSYEVYKGDDKQVARPILLEYLGRKGEDKTSTTQFAGWEVWNKLIQSK